METSVLVSWRGSLLGAGILLGLALVIVWQHGLQYTSTDAFCDQACHAHPHATQMWIQSAHFVNKRGIVTHCTDCHLPPDGLRYFTEKARLGMRDVYGEIFRDVSKIDWSRERRLERARTFSFDSACVHCHSNLFAPGLSEVAGALPPAPQQTSPEQVREMRVVARRMEAHLYYQRNRESLRCINCHLFEGHRIAKPTLPRAAATENAQFPLTTDGFQNYTDVVPGSNIKFHMIAVPAGTLEMGSPVLGACRQHDAAPARSVNVAPFWMGQATVSQRELDWFVGHSGAQTTPSDLTQRLAASYVDWLSRATGKKYRLPSEAELEYACLAGGTMPAWIQTDSRAMPRTSENAVELNAWGFMDFPDARTEFTFDAPQNPPGAWWYSDRIGTTFRVVRVPEANQATRSANSGMATQAQAPLPVSPLTAAPGKNLDP